jgi:hypothetical protein
VAGPKADVDLAHGSIPPRLGLDDAMRAPRDFQVLFFLEVTERFSDIASNNAPLLYCEKATDEGVYMGSKDMRRRYLLRMS